MESGSLMYDFVCQAEAIPVAPELLPGGLKKQVALEVLVPLKILHI